MPIALTPQYSYSQRIMNQPSPSSSSSSSSPTADTVSVVTENIPSMSGSAAFHIVSGRNPDSDSNSILRLPCKRRRSEGEGEREEKETGTDQDVPVTVAAPVRRVDIPPVYISRLNATTLGFNSLLAGYADNRDDYFVDLLATTELRQILELECSRRESCQPLLLNISAIYYGDLHFLEFLIAPFCTIYGSANSSTKFSRMVERLVQNSSFQCYFIHQLQKHYQPSLHAGNSLFIRLIRASQQLSANGECYIGVHVDKWIRALRRNSNVVSSRDDQGNSILAQLVKNGFAVDVAGALLYENDTIDLMDSIFDRNHAGEYVKDILMAHSPLYRTLAEQMHRDWYHGSRKYIYCMLIDHMISDVANLSLDYIDGGSEPTPPNEEGEQLAAMNMSQ